MDLVTNLLKWSTLFLVLFGSQPKTLNFQLDLSYPLMWLCVIVNVKIVKWKLVKINKKKDPMGIDQ